VILQQAVATKKSEATASEAAARRAEPCMPPEINAFTRAFLGESAQWSIAHVEKFELRAVCSRRGKSIVQKPPKVASRLYFTT
jgi:hypothetical protein